MGEVIQLQGDQRKDVKEFLVDKKEGLELDAKTIKVCRCLIVWNLTNHKQGSWVLDLPGYVSLSSTWWSTRSQLDKQYLLLLTTTIGLEGANTWRVRALMIPVIILFELIVGLRLIAL